MYFEQCISNTHTNQKYFVKADNITISLKYLFICINICSEVCLITINFCLKTFFWERLFGQFFLAHASIDVTLRVRNKRIINFKVEKRKTLVKIVLKH